MKKQLLLLALIISITTVAQSGFTNYKAVITDSGTPLSNHSVNVRFTILRGGIQVFQETQTAITDENGIFSLNIGEANSMDWFTIDWKQLGFILKTEVDSGSGFVDMGTQPFRFVPYAQHAVTAYSADVAYAVDYANVTNIPADIADGDDDTHLTEAQVDSYVANNGYANELNDLSDAKTEQSSLFIGDLAGSQNTGNSVSVGIGYNSLKNSTASFNTAIGSYTMEDNTNGSSNTAIGGYALNKNTDGNYNTVLGYNGMKNNTSASQNTAIGSKTLYNITSGLDNVVVGHSTAKNLQSGSGNTIIGAKAGYYNYNGNYNVFIGNKAGYNETGSNKLYIDNSNTNTPLIYGDFSSNMLKINGSLTINDGTQGYGKILMSDANGKASWTDIPNPVETKVLNIKPASFVPINDSNLIHRINKSYISSSNGTVSQYMFLPINLPIGAKIINVKVYYVDNSTTANLKCQIEKLQVNSSYNLVVGSALTSSGDSSNVQTFEFTSNLTLSTSYTYALLIYNINAAWGTDSIPKMYINGVKITYEE